MIMTEKEVYENLINAVVSWIGETVSGAGMHGVVVGLSGGIDCAVTAALCREALGSRNVLGLVMPCGSLEDDTKDGLRTGEYLGIQVREIDLNPVLAQFVMAGGLDPENKLNLGNAKARLRMTMEYAFSRGRLVAGTGNLSETVTGYSTKWGDGAADFFPLAELWKDEVKKLALHLDLPGWLLLREPSAGLWEGQTDENEMGVTYEELKKYHTQGRESVSEEAARRIGELYSSSAHKRHPIPFFHARGLLDE
jgi:NAD+ synthase